MDRRPYLDATPTSLPWWWIFDPRLSLRARAALLVGGGVAVFTLLFAFVTGTVYQRELQRTRGDSFESLAFQLGDKLDRVVYERYRALVAAASLDPLRRPGTTATERRRVIETFKESTPEFAWLGYADATGRVVTGTGGLFENTDASLRPWFRGAREQPFIGALREIPGLPREAPADTDIDGVTRYLELAVPVIADDGRFAGVLGAIVRWSWSREVQLSVVPETLARERIAVSVYGAAGDILLDSGALGWTHPPELPPVGESRRARGALLEQTPVGARFLTGFSRSRGFREYRGIGWITVVRQPADRAFAAALDLRRSLVRWSAVLTVAAAGLAWIAAGRHVRRIRSIGAAAQRIRDGDILAVLPRPADDSELSRMCRSVGDLVEDLRARHPPSSPESTPAPGTPHAPRSSPP
jgi:HAMP domain-containing protein